MEEEQEEMGNSLMALPSHYAKVQLRLQQVVSAPVDSREELLKDLHSFASMGIPDLRGRGGDASRDSEETQEAAVAEQGRKQAAAIAQLRAQLEELENYAYQVNIGFQKLEYWPNMVNIGEYCAKLQKFEQKSQSGDSAPPSRLLLERQRLVMERLKASFAFSVAGWFSSKYSGYSLVKYSK